MYPADRPCFIAALVAANVKQQDRVIFVSRGCGHKIIQDIFVNVAKGAHADDGDAANIVLAKDVPGVVGKF